MKSILVLLFFVKFSFAYQIYYKNNFNVTSLPEFHEKFCDRCGKFRDQECPKELKDEDILECLDEIGLFVLYCEPPKILDENNECVLEISSEEWREVMENSTYWVFIYLNNVDGAKFGKVFDKRNITIKDDIDYIFAAIGRTAEGEYKMFDLRTCFQEVGDRNVDDLYIEDGELNLSSMVKLSMPQLISIIFFLLLLIIYLTIEELRKTVYGKCWINFLINSLINYSAAIVQFINIIMEEDSFAPLSSTIRDTKRIKILDIFAFKVSSTFVIFTEFSLYFWLNITFFEAFYTLR
jgi:hypothetical protein